MVALSSALLGALLALPVLGSQPKPCECKWKADENECIPDMEKAKKAINDPKMGQYMDNAVKGEACAETTSKSSCMASNDCDWDESDNKCDLSMVLAMEMMEQMGGGGGGGLMEMMMKSAQCNALDQSGCGGNQDCGWKADKGECDVNDAMAMEWLLGGPMGMVLGQMMACEGFSTSETCGANDKCAWTSGKCDMDEAAAMMLFMGDSPVATMMVKSMACEALKSSGDCGADTDCMWTGNACDLSPALGAQFMGMAGGFAGVMADVQVRTMACQGLSTSGSCEGNSNCTWADGACGLANEVSTELMGPYMVMYGTCAALDSTGACSGNENCTWEDDDGGSCGLNPFVGAEGGFADFMRKESTCSEESSSSPCGAINYCKWDAQESSCGLKDEEYLKSMGLDGMPDGMGFMEKVSSCGGLASSGACNANTDCVWEESECSVSGEVWTEVLMGGGGESPFGKMMEKEEKCRRHSQGACSGDDECKYDSPKNECDLSDAVRMKTLFGDGRDVDEMVKRMEGCTSATESPNCDSQTCDTADADWARLTAQHSELSLLAAVFLHTFWGRF